MAQYLQEELQNDKLLTVLEKPSRTSGDKGKLKSGESPLNSWKDAIAQETIEKAHVILKAFNLDTIYDPNGIPYPNARTNLFKKELHATS